MPRGTIASWDKSRGSGVVKLDDGAELPFDHTLTTTKDIKAGMPAEVVTSIGFGGQLKARLVLLEPEGVAAKRFDEGFADLQLLGLLSAWTLKDAQDALGEPANLTRESAGTILLKYYGDHGVSVRSSADRVLVLDEHFGDSPKIPVADLASLAPDELQQKLKNAAKDLHPFSLGSVLNAFNAVLQQANVGHHYFLIDVDSDRHAVVALRNDAFARAAHASVLRIVS